MADLIDEAKVMVLRWHDLLHATGGDLAPEKSYWYLVELHWKNGRWQYKTMDDAPGDLWLPSSPAPIEHREVSTPAKALGIMSCPEGQMEDEVCHLQLKVVQWTENLKNCQVPKDVAWYCLNITIMKTIE